MRTGFIAIAILALVGQGCSDKAKTGGQAGPSAQPRPDGEAMAARASQAKGEAEMAGFRDGRTVASAQPELAAPQPLAPADGSEFNQFPRKTTLKWTPVTGAA